MNERVAAFHEAGHVVVAVFSQLIDLAGPVSIGANGEGAADLKQNNQQIFAVLGYDFNPDDVHTKFIFAYLAGPVAERIIVEREQIAVSEGETDGAGRFDKQMAEKRIERMEQPANLASYLNEVHDLLTGWMWAAVAEFAEELLTKRTLTIIEATELARDALRRHKLEL